MLFKNRLQWDKNIHADLFLSVSYGNTFFGKDVYCDFLTLKHALLGLAMSVSWYF